jgi:CO/xanthine dehydrogenase Mo-binding subunit
VTFQAAANEWNVPAAECSAAKSVIMHKPSGRTTTFGKVEFDRASYQNFWQWRDTDGFM